MKTFMKNLMHIKTNICFCFTASILLLMLLNLFFPQQVPVNAAFLWQFLLITVVGGLLQWLAFSNAVLKKTRYLLRQLIFMIPFFLFLLLCAWLFGWFPMERLSAWALFILAFLLAYVMISAGFAIYGRVTGKQYNEKLGEFKEKAKQQ